MTIEYTDRAGDLTPDGLAGFFAGWPAHPDPAAHLEILRRSHAVWIARDGGRPVGFVNAISDGVFAAHVPLLEVRPEYRGRGIGRELIRRMTETLADLYSIDVVCDEEVAPFYERLGFTRLTAMAKRNYGNQAGSTEGRPR